MSDESSLEAPTIINDKVATISYTVKDDKGQIIDSSEGDEPLVYLHGAKNIIVGLENELTGKAVGDAFDVTVEPSEGYGEYNADMVKVVPRDAFEGVDKVEPGMVFTAQTEGGPMQLMVTGIEGDQVTIDPNHPLAGKVLHFSGEVTDIRDASVEEISHGHVHGPGASGHHH